MTAAVSVNCTCKSKMMQFYQMLCYSTWYRQYEDNTFYSDWNHCAAGTNVKPEAHAGMESLGKLLLHDACL